MKGEITAENIVAFYEEYAKGGMEEFFKSEDIPEENPGPVIVRKCII